jgi:hypothetical protein
MVRWMRKARVAPGKFIEAMGFATEIAKYVKKFEGLPPVHVFIDSFGDMTTLRWVVDYESLAAMEKVNTQMMSDQEYFQKIDRSSHVFIPGSVKDVVMRLIET